MGNVTSIQRLQAGGSEERAKQNPWVRLVAEHAEAPAQKSIFGIFLSEKGGELYRTKQDIIF